MDIRTILDKLELLEAQMLDASTITKRAGRFDLFIDHIQNNKPFYTEDGEAVEIHMSEIPRLRKLYAEGKFTGAITLLDKNGKTWPLSKFLKTPPFGQAVPPGFGGTGTDGAEVGKEALIVKPSQIGITDKEIRAGDLSKEIIGNEQLSGTEYGQAIIEMAQQITRGADAYIPKELLANKNAVSAIVDYAGEYLGVLAMIHNTSEFSKRDEFLQWLGGNPTELMLNFPSKANTPLADSFATVTDPTSNRQINISSKGQGGGAAPSVGNLKVPDVLRKKPKFKIAVEFIDLTQNSSIPKPASVSQVFLAMNMLEQRRPDLVPAEFKPFLPWDPSIVEEVMASLREKTPLPRYKKLTAKQTTNATDGGKLAYEVKKAVMNAFNSGDIPEFQAAVLEILDYNFIQQYTDVDRKSGRLKFVTQWPAKLDGVVSVESKSSASDPTKGGFSFKLKPAGSKASEPEAPGDDEAPNAITGRSTDVKPKAAQAKLNKLAGKSSGNIGREER